jgi:hypothetical protein
MGELQLLELLKNPPSGEGIPSKMEYLRFYAREMAYVTPASYNESGKVFKKHLYGVLMTMVANERGIQEMRVISKYPAIQWETVWRNIHHTARSDAIKPTWYAVVHEIIPINDYLADKHLADTDRCPRCNELDSLPHRIIECRNGDTSWQWTRSKIAQILRSAPAYVPA